MGTQHGAVMPSHTRTDRKRIRPKRNRAETAKLYKCDTDLYVQVFVDHLFEQDGRHYTKTEFDKAVSDVTEASIFSDIKKRNENRLTQGEFENFMGEIVTESQYRPVMPTSYLTVEFFRAVWRDKDISFKATICYLIGGVLYWILGFQNYFIELSKFEKGKFSNKLALIACTSYSFGGFLFFDLAAKHRLKNSNDKWDKHRKFIAEVRIQGKIQFDEHLTEAERDEVESKVKHVKGVAQKLVI
jgi:hypothetical protein